MISRIIILLTLLFSGKASFAITAGTFKEFVEDKLVYTISYATMALISVAVLIYFFNIMKLTWGEKGPSEFKKLGSLVFWGMLVIFLMASIWGVLQFIQGILVRALL